MVFVQGHNGVVSERGRSSGQGQWMGWSVKGVGLLGRDINRSSCRDTIRSSWQNGHGYDNESGEELSTSLGTVPGVGLQAGTELGIQ